MSSILFLTICSNRKLPSSKEVDYIPAWGISEFTSKRLVDQLYAARRRVRRLATSDRVTRDGKPLCDLPYNQHLIDGVDLGGEIRQASYLPAIQRYDGRFFRELGTSEDRSKLARKIKHHLLIISGLYGVLTPTEPIQCYSCHVPDHDLIAGYWTQKIQSDLLTAILMDYIKHFKIKVVFDLMAVDAYRNLISWEMMRHAVRGNLLHCYSQQFAGPALLPSLGSMARKLLVAPETHLLQIKPYDTFHVPSDEIVFLPVPIPEPPLAREIDDQKELASLADEIGRMRRNIIRILDAALEDSRQGLFGERLAELGNSSIKGSYEIADMLHTFARIRNGVEYKNQNITSETWDVMTDIYNRAIIWADDKGLLKGIRLEKVDLQYL